MKYITASHERAAVRIDTAPPRRPFPRTWQLTPRAALRGQVLFLRRTNARGQLSLLGRSFTVAPLWPHRLVRSEVDLDAQVIRFYALRRRAPDEQPLLGTVPYDLLRRYRKK